MSVETSTSNGKATSAKLNHLSVNLTPPTLQTTSSTLSPPLATLITPQTKQKLDSPNRISLNSNMNKNVSLNVSNVNLDIKAVSRIFFIKRNIEIKLTTKVESILI